MEWSHNLCTNKHVDVTFEWSRFWFILVKSYCLPCYWMFSVCLLFAYCNFLPFDCYNEFITSCSKLIGDAYVHIMGVPPWYFFIIGILQNSCILVRALMAVLNHICSYSRISVDVITLRILLMKLLIKNMTIKF